MSKGGILTFALLFLRRWRTNAGLEREEDEDEEDILQQLAYKG